MKKIILGLALLASLAFGITFSKEQVKQFEQNCEAGDFEACSYAGALYKDPTEFGRNASDRDYKKTLYFTKKLAMEMFMRLARIWEQCTSTAKG